MPVPHALADKKNVTCPAAERQIAVNCTSPQLSGRFHGGAGFGVVFRNQTVITAATPADALDALVTLPSLATSRRAALMLREQATRVDAVGSANDGEGRRGGRRGSCSVTARLTPAPSFSCCWSARRWPC